MSKDYSRSRWRELGGLLLLAFSLLYFLSLLSYNPADISIIQSPPNQPPTNFIGPIGAWMAYITFMSLGIAGYSLPFLIGIFGIFMLFKPAETRLWPKLTWIMMILLSLNCLVELNSSFWSDVINRLNIGFAGGICGYLLNHLLLVRYMGEMGTGISAIAVLIIGFVLFFEISPIELLLSLSQKVAAFFNKDRKKYQDESEDEGLDYQQRQIARKRQRLEQFIQDQETVIEEQEHSDCKEREAYDELGPNHEASKKSARDRKQSKRQSPTKTNSATIAGNKLTQIPTSYKLPPLSLLDELPPLAEREIKEDMQSNVKILEETLADFDIDAKVINYESGPTVTSYEVLPAPGIRVEKIQGLSSNIALYMKAINIRIQAPIPGKGVVGIEIPNSKSTMVYLREILESKRWTSSKAALPLVLGKDVGGKEMVADLARMPHMLIAGATGSGKSVCMNSILAGLLMSRTPDQLRLMLVDPKIVEFSFFNDLPHLVVPVITDPKKVSLGLRWAINEMEKRYKIFKKVGVRNIEAFNLRPIPTERNAAKKTQSNKLGHQENDDFAPSPNEDGLDDVPPRLPYIVIIIDELADLMMVARADVEGAIMRLTQMARAVGIHMIIATQRPTVNVITGTIKANIPARIAFQVAQKNDSRTIIDTNGADKLLGKGDMLFFSTDIGKLTRAQGTMTTDREIREIVDFWKAQAEPHYEVTIKDKIENEDPVLDDDEIDGALLEQAVSIIRMTKRASTSHLQRRLRIGYTRAARLMDILEEKGIVGPLCGSNQREIMVDLDDDNTVSGQLNGEN